VVQESRLPAFLVAATGVSKDNTVITMHEILIEPGRTEKPAGRN
jgi:hypothetical protein